MVTVLDYDITVNELQSLYGIPFWEFKNDFEKVKPQILREKNTFRNKETEKKKEKENPKRA